MPNPLQLLCHKYQQARHALHLAWRHYQLTQIDFHSGLGDAGWILPGLVRAMKPEICVEIGSAHGFSTCLIALALKENLRGRLWAIDPHLPNSWSDHNSASTYTDLKRNLRALCIENYVTIVRQETIAAAALIPAHIDLAFIDGDHSYEGVRTDWEIVQPRMNPFGLVVFHDTLWERYGDKPSYQQYRHPDMGVPRLIEELRLAGYPVTTVAQCWGLSIVQPVVGGETVRRQA